MLCLELEGKPGSNIFLWKTITRKTCNVYLTTRTYKTHLYIFKQMFTDHMNGIEVMLVVKFFCSCLGVLDV